MPAAKKATRKAATSATSKRSASTSSGSRRSSLEIKIGVQYSAREIVLDVDLTADQVEKALSEATAGNSTLALDDIKGRRVLLPADKVTYIEIGEPSRSRVGFGAS